MTRTICSQIGNFFDSRITNALESAAEELTALSSIDDIHEPGDAGEDNTLNQDVAALRESLSHAAADFRRGFTAEVERRLLFTDDAGETRKDARKRRALSAPGFEVSLLSDDELELSVMTSTVASRFERRNREALERCIGPVSRAHGEERGERLKSLIGVFPLINRFSTLLNQMALSVPTRSRLMDAFQFHVLEELNQFYLPLATELERLRPERHKAPSQPAASPSPAGLEGWVQLLNGTRSGPGQAAVGDRSNATGGLSSAAHREGHSQWAAAGGDSSPVVSHDELVDCLERLPHTSPMGRGEAEGDTVTLYDHVVAGLEQHGISTTRMPAMDLDVLRLVSLFFETFLDDDELPAALRFLVGRLQLPVLQLALADGSFFDQDDHPARVLIQTLCRIGIGWSSDASWVQRSPVFKEVSDLIDRILDHPRPDAAVFEQAVGELEAMHTARQEKAGRVEGRVVELEVGRAKLRAAKLVVQDLLNEYLQRHRSLEPLKWFFADAWSKVLVFACLRHGCDSEPWQSARRLCDELAEVLTPSASREEWKQRFARVPNLLERLETRMVEAGFTSDAVDHAVEGVYAEIDRIRESEDDWFAGGGEMLVEQQGEIEPIELLPAPAGHDAGEADLPDWVEAGHWVRIADGDDPHRFHQVKVAARVAETYEVLLVDERGARWGIYSEQELAAGIAQGRITSAEQDDVVQKTLDAMIAQLTRDVPDAPDAPAGYQPIRTG